MSEGNLDSEINDPGIQKVLDKLEEQSTSHKDKNRTDLSILTSTSILGSNAYILGMEGAPQEKINLLITKGAEKMQKLYPGEENKTIINTSLEAELKRRREADEKSGKKAMYTVALENYLITQKPTDET